MGWGWLWRARNATGRGQWCWRIHLAAGITAARQASHWDFSEIFPQLKRDPHPRSYLFPGQPTFHNSSKGVGVKGPGFLPKTRTTQEPSQFQSSPGSCKAAQLLCLSCFLPFPEIQGLGEHSLINYLWYKFPYQDQPLRKPDLQH